MMANIFLSDDQLPAATISWGRGTASSMAGLVHQTKCVHCLLRMKSCRDYESCNRVQMHGQEFADPLIYCRCSIGGLGQGLDIHTKKYSVVEGCSTRKRNEQLACTIFHQPGLSWSGICSWAVAPVSVTLAFWGVTGIMIWVRFHVWGNTVRQ